MWRALIGHTSSRHSGWPLLSRAWGFGVGLTGTSAEGPPTLLVSLQSNRTEIQTLEMKDYQPYSCLKLVGPKMGRCHATSQACCFWRPCPSRTLNQMGIISWHLIKQMRSVFSFADKGNLVVSLTGWFPMRCFLLVVSCKVFWPIWVSLHHSWQGALSWCKLS